MVAADTIFALSSGRPPAAIGVIRVSGCQAATVLLRLAGRLPPPRRATLALLRDEDGTPLDRALLLWFPGPATATGEDLAELHCHGGRAVIAAVEAAIGRVAGCRPAEPGEYTRRAFDNGRMDLNAVEGLADLLIAETEGQRRAALTMAEGQFSRQLAAWGERLLSLSAMTEAALDFSDEDDVPDDGIERRTQSGIAALEHEIDAALAVPPAERLKDGIRVVIAGPPNAGKSTLLNALAGREAAIVSDMAGTTRDRVEVPLLLAGTPFVLTDTAGLREQGADRIETIGMDRARAAIDGADILLWLDPSVPPPREDGWTIAARCDLEGVASPTSHVLRLSAHSGEGMDRLRDRLIAAGRALLPAEGALALGERQRRGLTVIRMSLAAAREASDLLIVAEELRRARSQVDALTGRAGTEDMLDRLFGTFCIGK